MNREIYKIFDALMKIIIFTYLADFLKYIGEPRQIEEVLKSEITTLNGSTRYLDFLCRLTDGTLCHVEFQFPVAYTGDLKRFYKYNILAEVRFDGTAETIIFNFSTSKKGSVGISIGYSKDFHPKIFYLGDIDFEKELEKIHTKLNLVHLENIISNEKLNIQLTSEEELHLMLMSLAETCTNKKVFLKQAVRLLKNEKLFNKDKIDIIKSVIKLEIDNLLSEDEKIEFNGDLKMNRNAEKIIKDASEYVYKKYQQQAIDDAKEEGKKEGKEKGIEEVARKLKKIHSPEEISKLTGLSISTILLL